MSKLEDLCFATKYRILEAWDNGKGGVTLWVEDDVAVTYHLDEEEVRQLHTWLGAWLPEAEAEG